MLRTPLENLGVNSVLKFFSPLLFLCLWFSRAAVAADTSGPAGTWCLNSNSVRLTLQVTGPVTGPFTATLINENGGSEAVDNISWDTATRRLEFRRDGNGFWQWYRGTIVEGVLVGRFSHSGGSSAKPALAAYSCM